MAVSFTLLLLTALVACTRGYREVCCKHVGCFQIDGVFGHLPAPACPEVLQPSFALFTQANPGQPVFISRNETLPDSYDGEKMTMFVVHGYVGSPESEFTLGVKSGYLAKVDANVIIVDWRNGSSELWYPNSAANTRSIGAEIAALADRLKYETSASFANMWCVGLSLGAHTCGFAGMSTQFDRISGLDPAGPWFDGQDEKARIHPGTARFVDIIHTDGEGIDRLGMLTPSGDIDFYPNGGKYQPGCLTSPALGEHHTNGTGSPLLYCNHFRAAEYFIESLAVDDCFISRHICTDPYNIPGSCSSCKDNEICVEMGASAGDYDNRRGLYYLETDRKQPYCLY